MVLRTVETDPGALAWMRARAGREIAKAADYLDREITEYRFYVRVTFDVTGAELEVSAHPHPSDTDGEFTDANTLVATFVDWAEIKKEMAALK